MAGLGSSRRVLLRVDREDPFLSGLGQGINYHDTPHWIAPWIAHLTSLLNWLPGWMNISRPASRVPQRKTQTTQNRPEDFRETDMEDKEMDTIHKQGLNRWEPWKVVISAMTAGAALFAAGAAFSKLFL